MTAMITHKKVSSQPSDGDSTHVQGSDWNDDHNIDAPTLKTALGLAAVASSGSAADLGAGTLPAGRLPALTGDVTTSAGSAVTSIAANAVVTAKIADGNVTTAKIAAHAIDYTKEAQAPANTLVGNNTGSTADKTNLTVAQVLAMLNLKLGSFGDGSDGNATMDGSTAVAGCTLAGSTYTATRSVFFNTLTVNPGITFKPDGWPVHALALVNNGTIHSNGGNASGATNGTAAVSGSRLLPINMAIGNASTSAPQVFPASSASNGGAGGVGNTGAPGSDGGAGTVGRGGGGGGQGSQGASGTGGGGATAGSSATVTQANAVVGDVRRVEIAMRGATYDGVKFTPGTAGALGAGANAGGAGAAGGYMAFAVASVSGTGVWQSKGGNGGNATPVGNGNQAGGSGGGGGGAGGLVIFVWGGGGTLPVFDVSGGAGGAGGTGGTAATPNGGTGGAGGPGGSGVQVNL